MPGSKSSIDHRDIYYRLTKSSGYRARSAFKLLHLDEEFGLFEGVSTAVDLCAAPGSWSQVLSQKLANKLQDGMAKVVSLDLQPMAPLKDVTTLQTDITLPSTVPLVLNALGGRKADLVVCDGAPDVTGVHDLDSYLHNQLLLAAFTLALTLMAPNATLIFKIFLSPMDPKGEMLRSQMRPFFTAPPARPPAQSGEASGSGSSQLADMPGHVGFDLQGRRGGVWVRKPRSSRQGSSEAFLVCRNFDPVTVPLPQTYSPEALAQLAKQTGGTLALDTLATLCGEQADMGGPKWDALRRWVGSGDLGGLNGSEKMIADSTVAPSAQAESVRRTAAEASVPPPAVSSSGGSSAARERPRSRPFPASLDLGTDMTPVPVAHRRIPDRGTSGDSLSPASAFNTSPTLFLQDGVRDRERDKGWARIAPSPLPSPLYPPEGVSNGILGGPNAMSGENTGTFKDSYSLGTGIMPARSVGGLGFALADTAATTAPSSSLAPSRDESYLSSAAYTPGDSGAVSPALSTSSKTDLFFATDLSAHSLAGAMCPADLPRPPKPLSHSNSIGHGWPRGPSHRDGQTERDRRVTMPSTPTRLVQDPSNGQVPVEIEHLGLKMDSPVLQVDEDTASTSTLGESSKTAELFRSTSARERWRTASLPDRAIRAATGARSGPSPLILPGGSPLASGSVSIFANDYPSPTEDLSNQRDPLSPAGSGPSFILNSGPTPSRRLRDDEARRSGASHLGQGHAKRPSMGNRGESALAREEQRGGASEPGGSGGSVHEGEVMGPEAESGQFASAGQGTRQWRLVRKLGEGAFSAVWLADKVLDGSAGTSSASTSAVAIKLTARTLCISNDRTRISFLREVSVLRRLRHPNIVGFVDSFSTQMHHCLCIEQLGGGELFELLEKRGGLMHPRHDGGDDLVRRMFSELCEAVGWLHDVEVVHRDIKLENILLTMDPFVVSERDDGQHRLPPSDRPLLKLTDFGLARFIPSPPASPMLRTRCGSESFAAPEIIMGREYDGRDTDSWACGVVLYAMITGQLPFDDEPARPLNPVSAVGSSIGTPDAGTPGRNRGWSVSSVGSTSSAVEEKERRRKMLRIAKGQYIWPEGVPVDSKARRVVDMLLVRDPHRRVRVGDLRRGGDADSAAGWVMDLDQASEGHSHASSQMHEGRQVGKGRIMDDEREEGLYGDIE